MTLPVVVLTHQTVGEGTVNVVLTLTGVSDPGVGLGVPSVATVDIVEALVATITTVQNGSEAGPTSALATVTLSGPALTNTVVTYNVSGSAVNGTQYVALPGFVVIPQGSTSANITIQPIPDFVVSGNTTVTLTLSSSLTPTVLIGAPNSATVIITDVDVATVIATVPTASQIGPVNGVFTISLAVAAATATTITYSLGGLIVRCPFGAPLTSCHRKCNQWS